MHYMNLSVVDSTSGDCNYYIDVLQIAIAWRHQTNQVSRVEASKFSGCLGYFDTGYNRVMVSLKTITE